MKNNFINPKGLKGNQKIDRMKNLMGIKTVTESVVETKALENIKLGPDGRTYGIVRENRKYFVKRSDKSQNVSLDDLDYIGGLGNKFDESFSSYSDAIRRLNFKFNELNKVYNNNKNISVFKLDDNILTETVDEQKYKIKVPKPAAAPIEEPIDDPMGDEFSDAGMGDEFPEDPEGEEEFPMDDELGDEEEEDIIKGIQKLTGKLGQKIREADSEEMDSEMTKYVLNSTLSALDLSLLSEEDIEEAIERLEAGEEQLEDELEGGEEELGGEFPEEPAGEEEMELAEDELEEDKRWWMRRAKQGETGAVKKKKKVRKPSISAPKSTKKSGGKKPFYEGGSIVAESKVISEGFLNDIWGGLTSKLKEFIPELSDEEKQAIVDKVESVIGKSIDQITMGDVTLENGKKIMSGVSLSESEGVGRYGSLEPLSDSEKTFRNVVKKITTSAMIGGMIGMIAGLAPGFEGMRAVGAVVALIAFLFKDAHLWSSKGYANHDMYREKDLESDDEDISESTVISKQQLLETISEASDDYYEEDYEHVDTVYEKEEAVKEDCNCGDTVAEEELVDEVAFIDDALSGEFYDSGEESIEEQSPQPAEEPGEMPTIAPPEPDTHERQNPKKTPFRPKISPDPRPKGVGDDINIDGMDDIHFHLNA